MSALAGSTYPLLHLRRPAEARQRLDVAFTRLSQLNLSGGANRARSKPIRHCAPRLRGRPGDVLHAIEIYEELLPENPGLATETRYQPGRYGRLSRSCGTGWLYRRTGRNDFARWKHEDCSCGGIGTPGFRRATSSVANSARRAVRLSEPPRTMPDFTNYLRLSNVFPMLGVDYADYTVTAAP